jgi:hypothetical protein
MLNFRDCTLAQLDTTFQLNQVRTLIELEYWLNEPAEILDWEINILNLFQNKLIINVHDWNETELAYNFVGPIMALVNYTTDQSNFFAERLIIGTVDGIEMSGKPDGMIASGFREPKLPYFCFQEYKRDQDPNGDPAGQVLAAMLVAQELNNHLLPIYGCYIKGRDWFFCILKGKQYAISEPYIATRDEILIIFRILKVLKQIILRLREANIG